MKAPQNKSGIAGTSKIELPEEERGRLMRQCKKDPTSAGRTQYQRYLQGEKLTYREAVLAKCYDCDGGHSDGRYDCEVLSCPLRMYMPYKDKYSPHSLRVKEGEL